MIPDKSTLVVGYVNPDLDAYSCAMAYAELLSRDMIHVVAGKCGTPLNEVQFVTKFLQAPLLPTYDPTDFDQIVVVDSNRPSNLDPRIDAAKVVEVIDHRQGSVMNDFPKAKWQIEKVGAAATLIAEKFYQNEVRPSQVSATYLYAAIVSNTLNFQGAVTTDRDSQMAEWLSRYAQLPDDFATVLFTAKSDLTGDKLLLQLVGDFAQMDPVKGLRVGIGQIEMVGAKELIGQRSDEILVTLKSLAEEHDLDFVFTTLVDVEQGHTYFVTESIETQRFLGEALNLKFAENVAVLDKLILRKEYFMELKRVLDAK